MGQVIIRTVFSVRAVRHGTATMALVLVVCAGLAVLSGLSYSSARSQLRPLTGRAIGEIGRVNPDGTVLVGWNGRQATVELAAGAPPAGTRTEVAFDPADPAHAVIPGAEVLARADRAASGMTFAGLVALIVMVATGWRIGTRALAARRPAREALVRRVRVQTGLLSRSWVEAEDGRWRIPVYFSPALAALPTPSTVRLRGDPLRNRLVAVEFDGVRCYPSGPVRRPEPRGRRTDNPTRPEPGSSGGPGWLRQLRADAVQAVPAPFVGLLWAYLDGSGFAGWLGATVLMAAAALWLAAYRGSDPT